MNTTTDLTAIVAHVAIDAAIEQRNINILKNYKNIAKAVVNNKLNKSKANTAYLDLGLLQYVVHYELMTCNVLKIQLYLDNACKKLQCDKFNFSKCKSVIILHAIDYLKTKILVKQSLNELKARQAIERATTKCSDAVINDLQDAYARGAANKWADASTKHAQYLINTFNDYVLCNVLCNIPAE